MSCLCCCRRRTIPITNDAIPVPIPGTFVQTEVNLFFLKTNFKEGEDEIKTLSELQSIKDGGVSLQPTTIRPIRPANLGNGIIRPVPTHNSTHVGSLPTHVTPNTPCNTPNNPQKPAIIVSDPENIVTSVIVSDGKVGAANPETVDQPIPSKIVENVSENKTEGNQFSSTQITVDSASNAGNSTSEPVGQKMETTITSSTTTTENHNDKEGNVSSQTTVVTTESTKSEFHTIMTSSTSNVTSSPSEEPIGEIISQIVHESFNKHAAETSAAKISSGEITSNDDKKKDEHQIEHASNEGYPPVYIAVCPIKPLTTEVETKEMSQETNSDMPEPYLAICPAKPPTPVLELRKNTEEANQENKQEEEDEENQDSKEEERPQSTFEAFKNFVGGLMSSAVNAISPQSETTELKFNLENEIGSTVTATETEFSNSSAIEVKVESKIEDESKPEEESQIVTTEVVTNTLADVGLSSPGLVKEIISSKVEVIPLGSKDENEVVSSSITKESSAFVELPNGFRKEETTSTVQVITSHVSTEFKTDNIISSEFKTSGPIIVELSTSPYYPKADLIASESSPIEFKSANEESHTASSSLETTTSSTYYEVSSTTYESATEHFSSSFEANSNHSHVQTPDSTAKNPHDYSSFDVD